ncbi:unnamed protein product [Leptidea sinapis]|uniref:Uncharacterized protein n=1 Tax=Leptidea sinapis TaxID=189913 RepID=A0A5E4R2Y5_9NEOP|nr:unnamed protein product [Leptidea sinapis]
MLVLDWSRRDDDDPGSPASTTCLYANHCVVLCTGIYSSPFQDDSSFDRRAVETRPPHEPIATPVRASVESVPLR